MDRFVQGGNSVVRKQIRRTRTIEWTIIYEIVNGRFIFLLRIFKY